MKTKMGKGLDGLVPAIVIPLKPDFGIDEEVLKKYLSRLISSPIKAIAVNTDAGEGPLLLPEERKRIVSLVKESVKEKIPVVCGLAGPNTIQTLELAREFKDLGVDYFLVFPHPAFKGGKQKDTVIINYHQEIARVGVPLIIFQLHEKLGGVIYNLATLKELVMIDEVAAIKEASFDAQKFKETVSFLRSSKKEIAILTGNDNFILDSFILGSDGALIGFGSIFTEIQAEAIRLMKEKKYREGTSLFKKLRKICGACFSPPVRDYRVRIKEILVAQNIFRTSTVRPPLLPISEKERDMIHELVSKSFDS